MQRMSKWTVLLVSFIFALTTVANGKNRPATAPIYTSVYSGEPGENIASPADAKAIIREILDVIDVKASFEVREARIPNAAAATVNGKRYILYNPAFIAAIYKVTGSNRWAPISILAHEIGHHLKGHTLVPTRSNPAIELEADEFAGFVLRRMGASLEDAQLAIRIGSGRKASATHPGRQDRMDAIAAGWEKADEELVERGQPAGRRISEATARKKTSEAAPALDEQYIAYDVHFKADPGSRYHVTVRNNLVKVAGNQLAVFGKLLSTNSASYPYALKAGNHIFYVSRRGNIVTADGENLGYVKAHGQ